MSKYHNGAVLLLHAVSKSNTEALGDIIDSLRAKEYTFDTLNNL
jgi:peptidoglycan-N-acetylmuramic acid deacetylase